ncbi:uncharacterized protein LOC141646048 [Silene latifolia]|uniref:uncharacterized protein LOC141646048 n=1 Tax=Silene latifolia TaxID=37657 RepID=UPI003D77075D
MASTSQSFYVPCRAGASIQLPPHMCVDFTDIDESLTLLGQLQDQRYLDIARILDIVTAKWKLNGTVSVRRFEPYYLFSFSANQDYNYFRQRQTVNFDGSLLVFRPITPTSTPDNLLFHIVPLWIRVKHLPFHLMNTSVAAFLLSHVGDIYEEETYPSLLPPRNFVRVKVWIDLSKPLIPGCYLALNDREQQWISFSYEGVFRFCKTCGLVGHRISFCPSSKDAGARAIRARLDDLAARGLVVLHGPPGSPFYTTEIMGLPPRYKYLNTNIDLTVGDDAVVMDSGDTSPVFSFSSSDSDEPQAVGPSSTAPPEFQVHEDHSREVLLESSPLLGGNASVEPPSSSNYVPRSDAVPPSPSFRMHVPDEAMEDSPLLGLHALALPPEVIDISCLFRDSLASSSDAAMEPVEHASRALTLVYKRKRCKPTC